MKMYDIPILRDIKRKKKKEKILNGNKTKKEIKKLTEGKVLLLE